MKILLLSLTLLAADAVSAAPRSAVGVLVMAHGGTPEWNAAVTEAVAPLRAEMPVAIAFGIADRDSLQSATRALEAAGVRRIAVVRLFISGDSILPETEYLLGLRPDAPTPPEAVLILAHGAQADPENQQGLARMRSFAPRVRGLGRFVEIRIETLREDWPEKRVAAERRIRAFVEDQTRAGHRVLVVPFRLFGFGPYREVLKGLDYVADGTGLLPHAYITEWIRRQARDVIRRAGWDAVVVQ